MTAPISEFYQKYVEQPTQRFLKNNTRLDTLVIIVDHLARAAAMYSFQSILPGTLLTNCAISLATSFLYQITVEDRGCKSYFAVPACLGGMALHISLPHMALLINGMALQSLKIFDQAIAGIVPVLFYFAGVVLLSNKFVQVTHKIAKNEECCCLSNLSD